MTPGERRLLEIGLILGSIALLGLVVFFQQYTASLSSMTLTTASPEKAASERVSDPGVSQLTLESRAIVAAYAHPRPVGDKPVRWEDGESPMAALDQQGISRTDRLRIAMVAGELEGRRAALVRLSELEKEVDRGGELIVEIRTLKRLYERGREALSPEEEASLRDRHGWFGRLALCHNERSAEYNSLVSHRMALAGFGLGWGMVATVLFLAGIVAAVLALMRASRGEFSSNLGPSAGGTVLLETYVVFEAGFVLLLAAGLVAFGFAVEDTTSALVANQVLMWALALTPVYCIARGVKWDRLAWDVGLHPGAGLSREIGVGILAFLAFAPVNLIVAIIVHVIEVVVAGTTEAAEATGYPMFEPPAGNSWMLVILSALSSCIWAPFVEEFIFRGALFRYLAGYMRPIWVVLITSLAFGLAHPYSPAGLAQVAVSGVGFGLLRVWRGSIVACIVAHALHNASIEAPNLIAVGILAP